MGQTCSQSNEDRMTFRVNIETYQQQKQSIEYVTPETTIREIKQIIEQKIKQDVDAQQLSLGPRVLEDDETIGSLNLKKDDSLFLVYGDIVRRMKQN
ncbi:hypothetical protein pb186bvf_007102 [Paramecium bursaria]